MTDVICPICEEPKSSRGLYMHIKNAHPEDLERDGWRTLKARSRKVPKTPIFNPAEAEHPDLNEEEPEKKKPSPKDEMGAWTEQAQKAIGFYPSPAALAIINNFTSSVDPSDFVNEALINEGKRRGITAALIKTEGGQSLELMGTGNDDKEFDRILKLIAANSAMNQSFNANTPMIQMIQMMKEKVNKGMPMQEFMQMLMMMKQLEAPEPSNGSDLMQMMLMNKIKGVK
jgi:hypothetical protein